MKENLQYIFQYIYASNLQEKFQMCILKCIYLFPIHLQCQTLKDMYQLSKKQKSGHGFKGSPKNYNVKLPKSPQSSTHLPVLARALYVPIGRKTKQHWSYDAGAAWYSPYFILCKN